MSEFAAGFNSGLRLGARPAVLSIDLMRCYFTPDSPFCLPTTQSVDVAARVIEAARRGSTSVPVIHTRVEYGADGADGGVFVHKVPALRALIGRNDMNEIMPGVAPAEGELVITKQYASAFFGTSLASTLKSQGIDTLVVVGVTTSGCIRATVVDAMQNGFVAAVVRDGVGDRDPGPHEANLYDIQAKYAEVVDSDAAIAYLEGLQ